MLKIEIQINDINFEKIINSMDTVGDFQKNVMKGLNRTPSIIKNKIIAGYVTLNKKNYISKMNDLMHEQRLDIKVKDLKIKDL
jgi:hypothetical protein